MTQSHKARRAEVLRAIARWQIPVIQLNGMIAEHLGLNWTDLQAMYVLANHGPATPGELAHRVNLTSGSASRMIERLVRAGYVRRVPDAHDRRKILIEPDAQAVKRIGGLYGHLNDSHLRDLGQLDDAELTTLLRFVDAATERTEEEIQRFRQRSE
ncbi:MarR family winged helix-turn-helix transcriptional regulator [Kutzneria kofuensis]|uniref:DNA-binding MarR family transcriptional regulator n=1 Tax=Kutzneria kofuensis TaxID=103725 RepID=A0A7W9KQQ3_9PSEU|nr:MarR family transcriptional regulator [Kutzneria kofuensis]MBB5896954.1 DNA-binding MarR family transcriptional regulator [Kutzneria kofuensis]